MDRVGAGNEVAAVLLAGGASSRFDHELPKVLVPLGGRPLLASSLATLDASPVVDHVVLVVRASDRDRYEEVLEHLAPSKLRAVVTGGSTRSASERAGLAAVAALPATSWVMLHDAARPFVTLDLLRRLVDTARDGDVGVVPGQPLGEAVVDAEGRVAGTSRLVTVQTPQLFAVEDVVAAHRAAAAADVHGVDTAEVVATYRDRPIVWVDGDRRNLKVTTRDDLDRAERLLPTWREGRWVGDTGASA